MCYATPDYVFYDSCVEDEVRAVPCLALNETEITECLGCRVVLPLQQILKQKRFGYSIRAVVGRASE